MRTRITRTRMVAVAAAVLSAVVLLVAAPAAHATPTTSTDVTSNITAIDFGTQAIDEPIPGGPTLHFGTPLTVKLTNVANPAASQTLGTATVTGSDPAIFVLSSDTCSGATLANQGDTCTITVTANPIANLTHYSAELDVPVGDGTTQVPVTLQAVGAVVPPVYAVPGPDAVDLHWSQVPTVTTSSMTVPPTISAYDVFAGTAPNNMVKVDTVTDFTVQTDEKFNATTAAAVHGGQQYFFAVYPVEDGVTLPTNPPVSAIPWVAGGPGTYVPIGAARLLDTRTTTGGHHGKLTANPPLTLQVTGRGNVPSTGVEAVVLNITGTNPTVPLNLTAWPTGAPKPNTSDLNLATGETRGNMVTVPVGLGGRVQIADSLGSVDVVVDVMGYFSSGPTPQSVASGGAYQPAYQSYRVEDTRKSQFGPLASTAVDEIPVLAPDAFGQNINAVIVNITATDATFSGDLIAWNNGPIVPQVSTLHYNAGKTMSNMAIVPVGNCDQVSCEPGTRVISVYNRGLRAVHVIVDVVGAIDDDLVQGGSVYRPLATRTRIVDSRVNVGAHPLGSLGVTPVDLGGLGDFFTSAADTNLTIVHPTRQTYLTEWPYGYSDITRPDTSNVNADAGAVVASHAIAVVGPTNAYNVFNDFGTTDFLVDVSGTFEFRPYPGDPGTITPESVHGAHRHDRPSGAQLVPPSSGPVRRAG